MSESSPPIRSLDFSNYYIIWTVRPFFIFFCMKIEYLKTLKMMLSLFWKKCSFPQKRVKWSKTGRGQLEKKYIAQNWLIIFFLIFCIKVEGINGYKLAQTPFLRKFSFGRFSPFLLIFGPKINFLYIAQNWLIRFFWYFAWS